MNKTSCRPPTLIDSMIWIAATTIGFAGIRAETGDHYQQGTLYFDMERGKDSWTILAWSGPPQWYVYATTVAIEFAKSAPVLAAWTLAGLAGRLRRPRPTARRLFRQPGMVAESSVALALCVTTSLGLLQVAMAALGLSGMNDPRFYASASFLVCRTLRVEMIGMIVVVSWLLLAVSGRWRREPGWIDGSGILLGVGWIALMANQWFLGAFR